MSKTAGVLLIDKPAGITSHDVVDQVRRLISKTYSLKPKTGHTGTLDPFATGLLIVAIGSATRLIEYTHTLPKTYRTTITLGASSNTGDATGTITPNPNQPSISRGELQQVLPSFIGQQLQTPPHYAAIKIKGKKLYEYAREGQPIEAQPRPITIHALTLISYHYPHVTFEVTVSSGTYIRALARDIGEALNTSAYAQTLRRTAIGDFTIQKANTVEELQKSGLSQHLLPPQTLIGHLPKLQLSEKNVAKLKNGQAIEVPSVEHSPDTPIAIFNQSNQLAAIASSNSANPLLYPRKVLL